MFVECCGHSLILKSVRRNGERSTSMQASSQYAAAINPFSRPIRVTYSAPAVRSGAGVCVRYLREHWTKISVAVIGGLLAGFFAGAVSSREYMPMTHVVYAAGATNQSAPG